MKVAALAAAAALALQADATPVVGGGSFNAAPILEPGRYRDTILPGEYLFYGIRVGAGQRLSVTADTAFSDGELREVGVFAIYGNIHSPTRNVDVGSGSGSNFTIPNSANAPIQLQSPQVLDTEDDAVGGPWAGPGVYYAGFHARTTARQPLRAEVPLEIELAVDGTELPVATPTPTATPTPARTATPGPQEEGAGPQPAVAAGLGVGGLLIGVILAIVRRQRRR